MSTADVKRLVDELKASGLVERRTLEELDGFLASERRGKLHKDDAKFVRDLHARLLGGKERASREETRQTGTHENWQARALRAEEELSRLRSGPADAKFKEIKSRFAKRYHPNGGRYSGIEATVRAEVFKEFWTEFEDVENQKSSR